VELNDELRNEGMARELVNRIQNIRKDTGLEITDRINVTVESNELTDVAIAGFGDYIKGQVLADNITISDNNGVETEFDDFKLHITVIKH
jgi:isoleucyl-tRNA synthetase